MNETPISERVATLEAKMNGLKHTTEQLDKKLEHIEALMNTICVNMASVNTTMDRLVMDSSIWKNPFLYLTILSTAAAIVILFTK